VWPRSRTLLSTLPVAEQAVYSLRAIEHASLV
jgi:hypothetical protein